MEEIEIIFEETPTFSFEINETNDLTDIAIQKHNLDKTAHPDIQKLIPQVDKEYSPTSKNPQSGTAVAQAISTVGIKINNIDENKQYICQLQIINGKPVIEYEEEE